MNHYTKQLRAAATALSLFKMYSIDAVSEPEGFERGYSRQMDATHGDFDEFRQTTMRSAQKVTYVSLEKKIKHEITAGACGAAGAMHLKSTLTKDTDSVPAYFLPWDQRGGTVQMTIPNSDSTDVHEYPDLFFTAALSGCSVIFKGKPNLPTVIHAGSGQLALPYDANRFWKDFVEHLDSHPDPSIRHAKGHKPVVSQAVKDQYVTGKEIVVDGWKNKTTQHALDFKRKLSKHYGDTVEIAEVIPWGAVFGIRIGQAWTFYLQENANIIYYPRRKIQQVMAYTSGAPDSYDKWVRAMGPPRCVSRPMALMEVFPSGGGTATLTKRWRSLLRSDPLNDVAEAYAHDG